MKQIVFVLSLLLFHCFCFIWFFSVLKSRFFASFFSAIFYWFIVSTPFYWFAVISHLIRNRCHLRRCLFTEEKYFDDDDAMRGEIPADFPCLYLNLMDTLLAIQLEMFTLTGGLFALMIGIVEAHKRHFYLSFLIYLNLSIVIHFLFVFIRFLFIYVSFANYFTQLLLCEVR